MFFLISRNILHTPSHAPKACFSIYLLKKILDTIGAHPLTHSWKISTRFLNNRGT